VLSGDVPPALGDVADACAHRGGLGQQVVARDGGPARAGAQQGGEHAQRRGLAGAVRPEEADQFTGFDVDVDAPDGVDRRGAASSSLKCRVNPRVRITVASGFLGRACRP
jgi:hypothetical protein